MIVKLMLNKETLAGVLDPDKIEGLAIDKARSEGSSGLLVGQWEAYKVVVDSIESDRVHLAVDIRPEEDDDDEDVWSWDDFCRGL